MTLTVDAFTSKGTASGGSERVDSALTSPEVFDAVASSSRVRVDKQVIASTTAVDAARVTPVPALRPRLAFRIALGALVAVGPALAAHGHDPNGPRLSAGRRFDDAPAATAHQTQQRPAAPSSFHSIDVTCPGFDGYLKDVQLRIAGPLGQLRLNITVPRDWQQTDDGFALPPYSVIAGSLTFAIVAAEPSTSLLDRAVARGGHVIRRGPIGVWEVAEFRAETAANACTPCTPPGQPAYRTRAEGNELMVERLSAEESAADSCKRCSPISFAAARVHPDGRSLILARAFIPGDLDENQELDLAQVRAAVTEAKVAP